MSQPTVYVVCGGVSDEREVSLVSGRCFAEALSGGMNVTRIVLDENRVPAEVVRPGAVIFPAMHGCYGEDGALQAELEALGLAYAGSGPEASALCMDKGRTKAVLKKADLPVAEHLEFESGAAPSVDTLINRLGTRVVVKPLDKGSSVGLFLPETPEDLAAVLANLPAGRWMAEQRVVGRELTVGILGGEPLGIVEIVPQGGTYDYRHKYTPGMTDYRFPADLPEPLTAIIRDEARRAAHACGCRDFCRVDLLLREDGARVFLEINTIPGLTPTSLLPKSAACLGYSFETLAEAMVRPAIERSRQTGVVQT